MKVSIKPIETQCFAKDLAAGEKFTVVRPETITYKIRVYTRTAMTIGTHGASIDEDFVVGGLSSEAVVFRLPPEPQLVEIGELFKGTVFYSPDKPSELLMVTDGSSVVGMCNAVIIDGPLVDRTGTSVYLDEDHQVVVVPVE